MPIPFLTTPFLLISFAASPKFVDIISSLKIAKFMGPFDFRNFSNDWIQGLRKKVILDPYERKGCAIALCRGLMM